MVDFAGLSRRGTLPCGDPQDDFFRLSPAQPVVEATRNVRRVIMGQKVAGCGLLIVIIWGRRYFGLVASGKSSRFSDLEGESNLIGGNVAIGRRLG